MAHQLSISTGAVNQLFILGSIPFSTAAYLQLFQAANAGPPPGLIQSVSQALWPELPAWGLVGGIASSLCPKPPLPQLILI